MSEVETSETALFEELTGDETVTDDDVIDSDFQELHEVSSSSERDYQAFLECLAIHFDSSKNLDIRSNMLTACVQSADLNIIKALEFADIASMMSCDVSIQCKYGVMVSSTFVGESKALADLIGTTKQGKQLLYRIAKAYARLYREEPEQIRALGWTIEEASIAASCVLPSEPISARPILSPDAVEPPPESRPVVIANAAIVLQSSDPKEAGRMLVRLTRGSSREIVHQMPERILSLVQSGDMALGTTPSQSAEIVDMVVGEFPDEQAGQLVGSHLSSQRIVELIASSNERSLVAHVISPSVLVNGLARIVFDELKEGNEASAFETLMTVLHDFRHRSDWEEFLLFPVGHHQFRDYLLTAILVTQEATIGAAAKDEDSYEADRDEPMPDEDEEDSDLEAASNRPFEDEDPAHRAKMFAKELGELHLSEEMVRNISSDAFESFGLDALTSKEALLALFPSDHASDLTMTAFAEFGATVEVPEQSGVNQPRQDSAVSRDAAAEAAQVLF